MHIIVKTSWKWEVLIKENRKKVNAKWVVYLKLSIWINENVLTKWKKLLQSLYNLKLIACPILIEKWEVLTK